MPASVETKEFVIKLTTVWVGQENHDQRVASPSIIKCAVPESQGKDARQSPDGLEYGN
jgi:hypothetical protein